MPQHFLAPELCEEMVSRVTLADHGRRADANETLLVAQALTAAAIKVVGTIYPGNVARQVASVAGGIDPGDENFTWQRMDEVGMADYVANFGDDLPMVEAFTTEMTGKVKHVGTAFQFSTQDIRRLAAARKHGRQAAATLDINKLALADRVMERKKDDVFAFGDTTRGLPGMLTSANITQIDAIAPATGSNKSWVGPDKKPAEILRDMLNAVDTVWNQSKGNFRPNVLLLPIDRFRKIATTNVSTTGDTFRTILADFQAANRDSGIGEIRVIGWEKCSTADGGNPRGMAGYFAPETLELIDPLALTAQAPQWHNLSAKVPCEGRVGGTVIYQPLAHVYLDLI